MQSGITFNLVTSDEHRWALTGGKDEFGCDATGWLMIMSREEFADAELKSGRQTSGEVLSRWEEEEGTSR